MRSPYPANRVRVDRAPALPGAPRGPRTAPVGATADRDAMATAPVNGAAHYGWGSRVAPVTSRRSQRRPGWTPVIAGGQYVETMGERYVIR